MKLVVDIEQIIGNLSDLGSTTTDFNSACSSFSGSTCSCSIGSISSVLSSYKDGIVSDLNKISTSSSEYLTLVDECCSSYQENEAKTKEISMESISNIVTSATELFTDYEGNAEKDLTGLPSTELTYKVCEAEYAPSDKNGLYGTFTNSEGKEFVIYNQTEIYGNQSAWGVSWDANNKCTRCAVASVISGYSSSGAQEALTRNADWGGSSMTDTINQCSDGKLTAKYVNYSAETIKSVVSNGGACLVYVTPTAGKSGMQWTGQQHAMAILDYREDNGGEIFISTSGRQPSSSDGLWVPYNEFDNSLKSNQIIEVDQVK